MELSKQIKKSGLEFDLKEDENSIYLLLFPRKRPTCSRTVMCLHICKLNENFIQSFEEKKDDIINLIKIIKF